MGGCLRRLISNLVNDNFEGRVDCARSVPLRTLARGCSALIAELARHPDVRAGAPCGGCMALTMMYLELARGLFAFRRGRFRLFVSG